VIEVMSAGLPVKASRTVELAFSGYSVPAELVTGVISASQGRLAAWSSN
jgi:hypothetical protein